MVKESIFKTGDICGQSYRIARLVMRNAWIEKYFVKREDTQHTAILTCSRFRHIAGDPPSPELFKSIAERIRSAPFIELPKVYDFGVQGEVYWIATQYIDAPSIATLNKQGRPDATPEWRALDAASLASTVSATLGDIVKYDLLHGHLTPEHFVIDGLPFDMNVFLLDAGFADLFQFNEVAARHYLRYCAPELLNGKAIDQRSDIYSLGMVLYHLIAQHPPYWDKVKIDHDPALIPMVLEQSPTDLREFSYCPEPLWDLIVRAIHKDPDRRFQTIDDFYEMVQLAINKIEGEPRIQDFGEQVRREAEAKKRAVVPLITAKPRKEGDGPTTVPPGPNTEMKRRAAWLSALQNAALPRIAPEPSQCAEEPLSALESSAEEVEGPLFVAAEPSPKAKPKDEAEGPITSRSATGAGAREGRENARETPEASLTPSHEQKPAKGRAWLRNAWGWTVLASVIAASIFGAAYFLEPKRERTLKAEEAAQTHISIEVVASEGETESAKPPACAPNSCMVVAPVPCAKCELQKADAESSEPSGKATKDAKQAKPAPVRGVCGIGAFYCTMAQ